ncbi:MAG: ATP-dependent helicase [Bacteroidetes bacterium]|nr:ATP-dependent helicase [Bacteroidota bacterium]
MSREEKIKDIVNSVGHSNLTRITEKSDAQLDYVLSSISQNIFLKACPGSGKTEVIGLKTAYEMSNWKRKPAGIAVLTFTNNAVDVIKERSTQFIGNNKSSFPHFIGTIDSWLHGYLTQPLFGRGLQYIGVSRDRSLRIIDCKETSNFLLSFRTKYGVNKTGNVLANHFYYDYLQNKIIFSSKKQSIDTSRNETNLEQYQIDDLKNTKEKFWKSGFCTYQDMEQLNCKSLSHSVEIRNRLASRFPVLIIDECQDLSQIQLQILRYLMMSNTIIHMVGDLDQSIYEFKKVNPVFVDNFVKECSFIEKKLSDNFRSCQKIVDIACKIVNSDAVSGKERNICSDSCVYFPYEKDRISGLVERFEEYIKKSRLKLENSAILTRNWNNVYRLKNIKPETHNYQFQFAKAIHYWQNKDKSQQEEAIRIFGKFVASKYFDNYSINLREYSCPSCVKSTIAWRIFIANILTTIYESNSTIINLNQKWTDWAKVVRSDFFEITKKCIEILSGNISPEIKKKLNLTECKFNAPKKVGDCVVLNSITNSKQRFSELLITTIHSVKGQTFEAVLVVSLPSDKGTKDGFWKQWLDNPNSEAARLGYVASTRSKYLLAWAIPQPSNEDKTMLESLGFINHSEKLNNNVTQ